MSATAASVPGEADPVDGAPNLVGFGTVAAQDCVELELLGLGTERRKVAFKDASGLRCASRFLMELGRQHAVSGMFVVFIAVLSKWVLVFSKKLGAPGR